MLLAIGGYSKLLTAEVASIPSVSPVTSCPSFDLPEARQSHVAFNTHDNKVKLISSDTKVILIAPSEALYVMNYAHQPLFQFS